jgi:hypothetical protein
MRAIPNLCVKTGQAGLRKGRTRGKTGEPVSPETAVAWIWPLLIWGMYNAEKNARYRWLADP